MKYETRTSWVVGMAFAYNGWGGMIEHGLKQADTVTEARTDVSSVELNFDTDRWSYEGYWHQFKGYNLTDPGIDPPTYVVTRAEKREDMEATFYGASALFVKDPKDVWIGGRFMPYAPNLGYGASWIAMGRVASTFFQADGPLITAASAPKFANETAMVGYDWNTVGVGGGGAFSWAGESLRLGLSMALLVEQGHLNVHNSDLDRFQSGADWNFRLGIAWAEKDVEYGVFGLFDMDSVAARAVDLQANRDVIQTYFKMNLY